MLQITRLPEHQKRSDATCADLALIGFEFGKQCAQRISRGYAVTALQPDPAPLAAILHFGDVVDRFVADMRANNGLSDAGEIAIRAGYQRGLEAQLDNPNAEVVLKLRKPGERRNPTARATSLQPRI